jgi:hypothetical protein
MSMVQVNSGTCALKIAVSACVWLDVGMHVFNRHRFARAHAVARSKLSILFVAAEIVHSQQGRPGLILLRRMSPVVAQSGRSPK